MELKKGYKMTEVGEIPEGWNLTSFEDITSKIVGGGTPSRSNPIFWGKEIPWATVKDFSSFNPHETQEYITSEGLRNSASNLIPRGTLITSTRMALGKAVIYYCDVAINQDLKALFFKHTVDSRVIYYWFEKNQKKIEKIGSGSTVMGISLSDLKALQLALPIHLSEQIAIANALSNMDALIAQTEKLIEKKKAIKQGMMQQLLSPYDAEGTLKEGWVNRRLGDFIKFQVGFPFSATFFNRSGLGTRLIKNRDLKSNDSIFHYDGPYDKLFLVNNGDVLVGMDGEFTTCLWTGGHALLNQRVGRIVQRNEIDIRFLFYYLRKPLEEIENRTSSTTVKHLSHFDIEELTIPLPSYDDQLKISKILSDIDKEVTQSNMMIVKLKSLKQSMMQSLLTGKIRIYNPEHESATQV